MAEAEGEIEPDGKVLVIRCIHVNYTLKLEPSHQETAARVHGFHADFCPVARTIGGCVAITTSLQMVDL